jgi:hypothetical protein
MGGFIKGGEVLRRSLIFRVSGQNKVIVIIPELLGNVGKQLYYPLKF